MRRRAASCNLPFSHLLRCLLPSFPFRSSSLRFRLSRTGVSFRGSPPPVTPAFRATCGGTSSREMVKGLPVPSAAGETWSDSSAETVHASMSMGVLDWACGAGRRGRVVVWAFGLRLGGGGTAL